MLLFFYSCCTGNWHKFNKETILGKQYEFTKILRSCSGHDTQQQKNRNFHYIGQKPVSITCIYNSIYENIRRFWFFIMLL